MVSEFTRPVKFPHPAPDQPRQPRAQQKVYLVDIGLHALARGDRATVERITALMRDRGLCHA
jgi:hypothetical protein